MRNDIQCPYCGAGQDINHDDGYGYEEGTLHQQECVQCEKTFTFETTITFYYEAYKADCLNGGEHEFEETTTYPVMYKKLKCKICDETKPISEERMQELLDKNG